MPNAKDAPLDINTLLILGGTGAGKTTQFLSYRGRKFSYLFDQNALASLRGQDVEYETFIPEHMDLDVVSMKANTRDKYSKAPEPKTYIEFEKDFEHKLDTGFFNDIDAFGFDSTTMFSDIVMDRVQWLNGRFGKQPEMTDYVAATNTIIKVYRTILGLNIPIFITGHIEHGKDEVSGRLQNTIHMLGRLRTRIPIMFQQVWLAYNEPDRNGNSVYKVRTRQDRTNPFLRCTNRFIDNIETVTLDFNKPLEGQGVTGLLERDAISKGA